MNNTTTNFGAKKFIPLAICIIIIILFGIFKLSPKTAEWIRAREEKNTLEETIKETSDLIITNQEKEKTLKTQFDAEAKDFILEESQLYPEFFDSYYVTKTLELFAIQYSRLRANSSITIRRISFPGGTKDGKTVLTLDISCTEESLKDLIKYLQSGILPKEIMGNDLSEPKDVDYLEEHRLPLAHIEAINVSDANNSDIYKNISLKVSFFTQK